MTVERGVCPECGGLIIREGGGPWQHVSDDGTVTVVASRPPPYGSGRPHAAVPPAENLLRDSADTDSGGGDG